MFGLLFYLIRAYLAFFEDLRADDNAAVDEMKSKLKHAESGENGHLMHCAKASPCLHAYGGRLNCNSFL